MLGLWVWRRAFNRAWRTVTNEATANAQQNAGWEGTSANRHSRGTQSCGEGKAISAEDKAASGMGRGGHKFLWAGKQKLKRVFRAVGAGCSPAEVRGEAECPRPCACGLPNALALALPNSPGTVNGRMKCTQLLPLAVKQDAPWALWTLLAGMTKVLFLEQLRQTLPTANNSQT